MSVSEGTVDGRSPGTVTDIRSNMEQVIADENTAVSMTTPGRPRFGSQDELESPHLEAIRAALSGFDASVLDDMAKKSMWTSDTIIDNQKFRNPLHYLIECYMNASEAGTVSSLQQSFAECLSVLVEHGLDINEGDLSRNTPLHLLCNHCGIDDVIKTLMASGSKVNAENTNLQTALHLAAENGSSKDVETLLEGGADPNKLDCLGMGPLHIAVKFRRNQDMIKFLVGCGAIVDLQSLDGHRRTGSTAIHIAVREDRKENVKLLIELGAKTEVIDSSGQTPLHLAAKYDITGDIVKYLLQGGAHINCKDAIYGETPIHKAIKRNMEENTKVLVRAGASLSKPDASGDSPLHTAALCCQNVAMWVTLMNAPQADIRIRNSKGQNVFERAVRASNKLGINILKQIDG